MQMPTCLDGRACKQSLKIDTLLQKAKYDLARAGIEHPAFEASYLLEETLGLSRTEIFLYGDRAVSARDCTLFQAMVRQRTAGRPLQYIVGKTHFWSKEFRVTPDVLIPRPETEFVVEQAIDRLRAWQSTTGCMQLLDLGTGSGVIADILADELACNVLGVDISESALLVARHNIEAHNLESRVSLLCSDLFAALAPAGAFQAIIANLPYVETTQRQFLDREVVDHEPALALFAGPDGLDCYRRLVSEAGDYLCDGGWLILEIGAAQKQKIARMLIESGFMDIDILHDYGGLPRCACARKKESQA